MIYLIITVFTFSFFYGIIIVMIDWFTISIIIRIIILLISFLRFQKCL